MLLSTWMTRWPSHRVAAVGLVAASFAGTPAHADVAPDPGYVETCTVEKQQEGGAECRSCVGSFQDAGGVSEECRALESDGYSKKCQTAGASTWTEVWCKGDAPAAPDANENADTDAAPGSCTAAPAPLGAFVAGLMLFAGLRRRRAQPSTPPHA